MTLNGQCKRLILRNSPVPVSRNARETYELLLNHLSKIPADEQEVFLVKMLLLCAVRLPYEVLKEIIDLAQSDLALGSNDIEISAN